MAIIELNCVGNSIKCILIELQFFPSLNFSEKSPQKLNESQNGGESYFVSSKMFDSMNLCRCGRKKQGTHLIKCMQKSVIKYSDGQVSTGSSPTGENEGPQINIPRTSNEIFGFFKSKYTHLERSTFYITPKAHLKHKIYDQIYDNIIIG